MREIVRLLGSVALSHGSRNERREAIMTGLAALVKADAWLWFTPAHATPGRQPAYTIFLHGGFTEEGFARMMKAGEHPDMAGLTAPFFEDLQRTGGHVTRLRQQVDPEGKFQESGAYPLWKEADIAPLILSARPGSGGQISMIGLYRKFDGPLFDRRESRIAHILLSEIPDLHDDTIPETFNSGVASLSARLRQVFNCLLVGQSRKEIAAGLELSIHTVGEYISEIYRRFDVHSQTELIRRFLVGDGGDQSADPLG